MIAAAARRTLRHRTSLPACFTQPAAAAAAACLPRAFSTRSLLSHMSTPAAPPVSAGAGAYAVKRADEGISFWQPKPANGYVVVSASPWYAPALPFSQGTQVLPVGCHVRPHTHAAQSEVITCVSGEGHAIVGAEGQRYEMRAGCTLSLPSGVSHSFHNDSADRPLTFLWTISPPGLEDFFQSIGRPRVAGEEAPEPFERPSQADIDAKHNMKA